MRITNLLSKVIRNRKLPFYNLIFFFFKERNDYLLFYIPVSVFPEPTVLWFRDEEIIENNDRIKLEKEKLGFYHLTINKLEFPDQVI